MEIPVSSDMQKGGRPGQYLREHWIILINTASSRYFGKPRNAQVVHVYVPAHASHFSHSSAVKHDQNYGDYSRNKQPRMQELAKPFSIRTV